MFSLNPQIAWLILPVVICLSQRRSLGHSQCGHEGRLVQFLLPPAATLCAVASLPLAPTMSAPAGAVTAHERLLAAVSAADALPRGTTFEKVKGARDRLRGELLSVQRMDGDELVKSATACAHRLNQRLSRMRKLGMDAPADAPAPAPAKAPIKSEPAPAPEPAPAKAPIKSEPAPAPEPAPAEAPVKPKPAPAREPAPEAPTPAMSSALRAIQSLWCTLATERTPGNIEMYRLFWRLGSTISSADLHVEDLRGHPAGTVEVSQVHGVSLQPIFRPLPSPRLVSTGIFCLTNLFAEVQARMCASLARGKKRKADEL